eukprot:843263-Pelagomonas_calceolata.AAC.1
MRKIVSIEADILKPCADALLLKRRAGLHVYVYVLSTEALGGNYSSQSCLCDVALFEAAQILMVETNVAEIILEGKNRMEASIENSGKL